MCRSTKLADDVVVNLRAYAQSGAVADEDGTVTVASLGVMPGSALVGPSALSVWEETGGDEDTSREGDTFDGDGSLVDEDEDLVAFEDRLEFADALERAWLCMQSRQLTAIRTGLAQVTSEGAVKV